MLHFHDKPLYVSDFSVADGGLWAGHIPSYGFAEKVSLPSTSGAREACLKLHTGLATYSVMTLCYAQANGGDYDQ